MIPKNLSYKELHLYPAEKLLNYRDIIAFSSTASKKHFVTFDRQNRSNLFASRFNDLSCCISKSMRSTICISIGSLINLNHAIQYTIVYRRG